MTRWRPRLVLPFHRSICVRRKLFTDKLLVDVYAYPGFRPPRTVEGLFGDRFARIVVFKRRGKKPSAGPVVRSIGPAMTATDEESATCPAATKVSRF